MISILFASKNSVYLPKSLAGMIDLQLGDVRWLLVTADQSGKSGNLMTSSNLDQAELAKMLRNALAAVMDRPAGDYFAK